MKLRKDDKAGIGTIIMIIIVIIAIAFFSWWFLLGGQCDAYPDVKKEDTGGGYLAHTHVNHPYADINFVQIAYEPAPKDYWDLIWRTGATSVASVKNLAFDDIPDAIEFNLVGTQKATAMHIWEAIDKGCV